MRVAVAYDNGEVFQHFGRTEAFKVYEVEENKIISSEVLESNGVGHEALAGLLAENTVDVLICGGIGGGAQSALSEAGIEVISGAEGDTDAVVEAYLRDELVSTGVNCNHHGEGHTCGNHEDGHSCGGHEDGHSCGGCGNHEDENGCGGHGCGGCGGHMITLEGRNAGKTCKTHYRGTFNDGTQFDSSYDRGEPLEFVCGAGMMIPGFDAAVVNMEVGQKVDIHLMPEEAYGESDPNAIFTVEISEIPGAEDVEAGQQVYLQDQMGRPIPVMVTAKDDKTITFDANHEMAGKELNFTIELVEVSE
ncbi:MAG: FKBP-type peptidyl-prolyl cis-trans isomerase [Lachnospira sp.]|nr:FKBP-type peptidyl-prolyl cis-trans isomerase [Lachnospira sp.]